MEIVRVISITTKAMAGVPTLSFVELPGGGLRAEEGIPFALESESAKMPTAHPET